jgi:hypothetical protein
MLGKYTAGSFTKNFAWHSSCEGLHSAIANGFSQGLRPVTRDVWRERSRVDDPDRELIPMNFFLYSRSGVRSDFILVDTLVEAATSRPYNQDFARLALFAFHLANSGSWRNSKWPDGRVAGWAHELIRDVAWRNGSWVDGAFQERPLEQFIDNRIAGEPTTKRKVFTNYRHMLVSAGVLPGGRLQLLPADFRQQWIVDAIHLFWDRQIFDGELPAGTGARAYEDAFFRHEVFKLLGCDVAQGKESVRAAFREYSKATIAERLDQIRKLNDKTLN